MHQPRINLPDDDDKLLAQCDLQTFRSSGPGGQHVNKTETAVRLLHRPSGIVVVSRLHRSQWRNRLDCLQQLRERVQRLNYRKPSRIATKVSKAAKLRRLTQKRQRAETKQRRQRPGGDD